jgi:phosphoenolpyruvate-protein kinase (PTS system EI component)
MAKDKSHSPIHSIDKQRRELENDLHQGHVSDDAADRCIDAMDVLDRQLAATEAQTITELVVKLRRVVALCQPLGPSSTLASAEDLLLKSILHDAEHISEAGRD